MLGDCRLPDQRPAVKTDDEKSSRRTSKFREYFETLPKHEIRGKEENKDGGGGLRKTGLTKNSWIDGLKNARSKEEG